MKIVFAATPEQEEKVNELIDFIYSDIFPQYFSDEEIRQFEQHGVLDYKKDCEQGEAFDTLGHAYKAITCLQTIISILESYEPQTDYQAVFEKNVSMLSEIGIYFPFTLESFEMDGRIAKVDLFSIYAKPVNQYLI